jgi:oligoendopeptidase F
LLSETEERLLEETANTGARAFGRLFSEITSNAVFRMGDQELNQSEIIAKLSSSDREERRAAAAAFSEGIQGNLRTIVFLFNTLLQDKNVKDRLRRYGYPEQTRHMANELRQETVDLVVETVARNYPLVARYYHVKREILGLDSLTHYDRYAPLFEAEGVVTYPEARTIVLDAFGVFSPKMRDLAGEFFDKGWIDVPPAKGKQGGAYCQYVTPDLHPYVFMNFLGRMRDVMTLAHELGHGIHASLSRTQSLLNFQGTLPLAELASTFGEMLVFEKIQAKATLKDKLAMYAGKIDDSFATIPRQTALYRFEQAIHAHRRTQGELTPTDFGDYWQREIQAMFGDSVVLGDEHRDWWSYIGHFVGSPFYVYAYSFGELLALSLYRQAQTGGAAFADRYLDMLRVGGSHTPQELMARVGVDLDDPQFWQGGFDVLESLVARFEELWQEYKQTLT